ncbi:MAG: hypothetical protein ACD_49C00074G0002 [uncultured bacterium (gcode 4)]|uniref:Lcl C-terminal domain-containing protein n=1 Tax=uncultured bacterium (gcode 4) TaxID=1234023 RepID=K2AD15_9BACT|nr:MAG: hypothetical protein ACD_49C00074G0002 [uncultured bacterium (gcode 4)]
MRTLLKNLISKIGNWLLIWIWIVLSIWIFGIIYAAYTWTTQAPVSAGSPLTATAWNDMLNNLNYLKQETWKLWTLSSGKMCTSDWNKIDCVTTIPSASDCVWASVWASCGGWKYAWWGLVAMTSDESLMAWSTAFSACLWKTTWWFTDWRLPTIDELKILFINKATIWGFSTVPINPSSYYWSSSEYSSTNAYMLVFITGYTTNVPMTTAYASRCVRKF